MEFVKTDIVTTHIFTLGHQSMRVHEGKRKNSPCITERQHHQDNSNTCCITKHSHL